MNRIIWLALALCFGASCQASQFSALGVPIKKPLPSTITEISEGEAVVEDKI